MPLDSLSFLFLALPCSILLCRITPARLRSTVLLGISLLLYQWIEGTHYLGLLCAVVLFDYVMVRLLRKCKKFPGLRRVILVCSLAKSVGLFVFYQVWFQLDATPIPLGLGIVCLTSTGYVIECCSGFIHGEKNPVNFALMTLFFPKLYAGPLVNASKVLPQLRVMRITLSKTGAGAELLIQGLAKKVIIGETAYGIYVTLKRTPIFDMTPLTAWTLVVMLAFSMYFILSGYSEMAKGIGLLFGFELPDNFNHPYSAVSVNDFFSRFNITVNRFIRRNVYFHLGGSSGGMLSNIFNVLLVTMLMGLWFGIRTNTLLWGIYFAVFVILERYALKKYLDQIPTLFRWLYTVIVVLISFVILAGDTPGSAYAYLQVMFGVGMAAGTDGDTIYLLTSNFVVLLAAVVCSTSIPAMIADFFKRHTPLARDVVSAVLHGILLIITVSLML